MRYFAAMAPLPTRLVGAFSPGSGSTVGDTGDPRTPLREPAADLGIRYVLCARRAQVPATGAQFERRDRTWYPTECTENWAS